MKTRNAYLKPKHQYAFNHPSGKNGKIVGIEFVTPNGLSERLCYKLKWDDGMEDYTPVSDAYYGLYIIVDENGDVINND